MKNNIIKGLIKKSKNIAPAIRRKTKWSESDFMALYFSGAEMIDGELKFSIDNLKSIVLDSRTPKRIKEKSESFLQVFESVKDEPLNNQMEVMDELFNR